MGLPQLLWVTTVAVVGWQESVAASKPDYSAISNAEITFHGTIVGVVPSLKGKTKSLFEKAKTSKPKASELVKLLDHPRKYLAAHYFLTFLYLKKYPITTTHFNSLEVRIGAREEIPPNQMERLKNQWMDWLKENPGQE